MNCMQLSLFICILGIVPKVYAESNSDNNPIIVEAQNMVLNGKRLEAIQLLNEAIQNKSENNDDRKSYVEKLDQLSTMFITDSALKKHEFAQSLYFSESKGTLVALFAAQKKEPHNLSIKTALIRYYLSKGSCAKAGQELAKAKQINKWSRNLKMLSLSFFICQENYKLLQAEVEKLDKEGVQSAEGTLAKIQVLYHLGKKNEALKIIQAGINTFKNLPELYFWLWQVMKDQDSKNKAAAEKYVRLCSPINPRIKRAYLNLPKLCASLDIAKEYLEKPIGENE